MSNKFDPNERIKMSFQMWMYSVQRIDLLLISICGAGIYAALEALKYASEKQLTSGIWMIKIAGLFFIFGIIVNFISQFTGKKANADDMKMWSAIIEENIDNEEKFDKSSEWHSILTRRLNVSSLVLMSLGLLFLSLYFIITF